MKFFTTAMLLACMVYASSSVFADLEEINDAEERRAIVSQLDSSNNPNHSLERAASNERVRTRKQEVSPEDNPRRDVFLNKKISSSESPEKEPMRRLHRSNEIIQLEERVSEQSETNAKNSQRATTEGRLAKLGLKVGEEIDLMLTKIKNKMKNYFPLRS